MMQRRREWINKRQENIQERRKLIKEKDRAVKIITIKIRLEDKIEKKEGKDRDKRRKKE